MRKIVTTLIWVTLALLALFLVVGPATGLKLSEAIVIDLMFGIPALAFLYFLRWVLRPRPAPEAPK
ncbi:MAG: hypothetical protein ACLPJH_16025 [Myxococcaceae bacterium]